MGPRGGLSMGRGVTIPGGLGLTGVIIFLLIQVLSGGGPSGAYSVDDPFGASAAGARARRGAGHSGRAGSRARPEGVQHLRLQQHARHLDADLQGGGQAVRAREGRALPRRRLHGLRRRVVGRRPVLLPDRPARVPRPQLLPRHGEQARRTRRLRLGVRDRARGRPSRAAAARHQRRGEPACSTQNPGDANALSVRLELQADCYAGVWAHSVFAAGDLEKGDVSEAIRAAGAVGDDRLQRQATGQVNPDTFTHGTSEQRERWFNRGRASGVARRLRHLLAGPGLVLRAVGGREKSGSAP